MDKLISENPQNALETDPLWLNYAIKIREIREQLSSPLTQEGEQITKDVFNNPVFIVYNRLQPIFAGLVSLIEADEILKEDSNNPFQDPKTQRLILRAFNLLVEDQIKYPYNEDEIKKYEDYKVFFEGFLKRTRSIDNQIKEGGSLPNFINSISLILSQQMDYLPGVRNSSINTQKIRRKIQSFIPQLALMENGNILREIKNRWQKALIYETIK